MATLNIEMSEYQAEEIIKEQERARAMLGAQEEQK